MIYFTADPHFGHANIIKHCNRPFHSAAHMDSALTSNWNIRVKPEDEVYILGDFTMRPAEEAHEYLTRLNGRKYFIRGNHDKFLNSFELYADDFKWVKDYHVLKAFGYRFVLFHYPILEWDGFFRNSIHLYGHIHNNEISTGRAKAQGGQMFNVGVDVTGFVPVSINEVIKRSAEISL